MIIYEDNVLRDIGTLLKLDEDDYYKPIKTGNVLSSNYIKYESNGALSVKEYLDMIRSYLSGIINDYKTQGEWKIYLTMAIN